MVHTPEQKKAIKGCFEEISNSMARAKAESELQAEIIKKLKTEFELSPTLARKLATTYHKRNIQEVIAQNDDFEEYYDSVFNTK